MAVAEGDRREGGRSANSHPLVTVWRRTRRVRATPNLLIRSQLLSLLITIIYNTIQHSTTRVTWVCERLRSAQSVVRCCPKLAFVEFKFTVAAQLWNCEAGTLVPLLRPAKATLPQQMTTRCSRQTRSRRRRSPPARPRTRSQAQDCSCRWWPIR